MLSTLGAITPAFPRCSSQPGQWAGAGMNTKAPLAGFDGFMMKWRTSLARWSTVTNPTSAFLWPSKSLITGRQRGPMRSLAPPRRVPEIAGSLRESEAGSAAGAGSHGASCCKKVRSTCPSGGEYHAGAPEIMDDALESDRRLWEKPFRRPSQS